MRKAYILKRLTKQVKHFAALMLIVLMAAGNVFADEVTFVFSEQGYANAQVITAGDVNDIISFACDKNSASTSPTYYTSGNALRFYAHAASGNGNSMTLVPQAGYEITGLSITATGASNAPTIGVEVDGGTRVTHDADGAVYTISGLHAVSSLMFINAATSNVQLRITSMTITYGEVVPPAVIAPAFSIPSGNYYTEQTVSLTCETAGANIYYSINGAAPVLYNAPFTISATADVAACAILGEDTSAVSTAHYSFPMFLNNIAAFYAAENADLFKITGDVTYVYRNGRYMYVKDATGGLLVYDNYTPVITNEYNNGDVISGGIVGTRSIYNGLAELVPVADAAAGVAGEAVAPIVVTAAELLANPEDYVSQLVMVVNGEFAAGSFNTNSATNVNFTQNGSTIVVRNGFRTVSKTFAAGDQASVIGFVTIYNTEVQLFPRDNNDIITSDLPVADNFDDGSAYAWTLVNGENTNKWYIGTAQGFDNNKLYISSSNGVTNKYNVSATSTVHAYKKVNLPNSDVLLSFDIRSMGDANDYLQVSILDEVPEAGTIPANSLTRIFNVSEFGNKTVLIPSSYAGEKYIVFTWHNNASGGTQAPAAIDNVMLESTCTQVSNIASTVNEHTAVITWNAPEGQNAWTLEYKADNADVWQTVNATATSVTLNNLSTETTYDVRVRANCGDNSSAWVNSQFYVPCIALTTAPLNITIGTGTTTSYYAPFGPFYKNSWVQMIYPASNFESGGYINSLSWEVNAANVHNCSTLKIYLGTIDRLSTLSSTDWLPMSDLTLVYDAANVSIGGAAGWETYTLTTPFYYNGEDNLVVVTSRTAAEYKSLYYKCTSGASNSVMYRWNDNDASYASHPGTNAATGRNANIPNMKIDYTGYVCDDDHCAAPADLMVSNVTTTGASLTWEAGDATSWVLGYKTADAAEWTMVNLTDNAYELSGLEQNTPYEVRVKADCGTIGMSGEAVLNFTTVANCIAPQQLTAVAHAHTVNVSWLPMEGVNHYEVSVQGINNDTEVNVDVLNASQTNITSLVEGGQYNIMVRALCGEENNSDWTSVNFTMPAICPTITGLSLVETNANTATLTWNAGNASTWVLEYGLAGFTLGEGTQVSVSENTVVLAGLNPYTTYEAYVKGDCGLGYVSNWSSKLVFKTDCGSILVTEENPWLENFDIYTGSNNLAFDNCWATPVMTSYNSPFIYRNYATVAHSGANTVEMKGDVGATAMLVLPVFVNPLNELQFSYYGMVTGTTPGTMELGYITDVTDASTFVVLYNIPAQQGSYNRAHSLMYGPFSFNGEIPAGARIALQFTSATNNCSWNLDDFTVALKPNCQVPTMVTAADVTANTVTLAWTANGSETAWNIEYGPAGFELGTGTTVTADANPFTVTGLNDATSYDFYVQANCGTSTSDFSPSVSATTPCLPMATPYNENFDSYAGSSYTAAGVVPVCWEAFTDNTNKSYAPHVNTGSNGAFNYAQSGKGLGFYSNSAGSNSFAILPLFELPLNTMTLSFWRRMESATQGVLTVGYVTNVNDPINSYTVVATIPSVTTTNNDYSVDFSNYEGTIPAGARIAFHWYKESTWYTCAIDNVSVSSSEDASCFPVTGITAGNVTYNSAVLTWTPGADETAWIVNYKAADAEAWSTTTVSAPTCTLSGLSSATEYMVSIISVCGEEDMSLPATATFTTTCGSPCTYTFFLHDSYGDGWNGNAISIVFSSGGSQVITVSSGYEDSFLVEIPAGDTMTCNWVAGSYPGETSFDILNDCGDTVYSGSNTQSNGFFTSICPDFSSCPKPKQLTVSDITVNSAILSWTSTGTETSWIVNFKAEGATEWQTATATATTFPLMGLDPNTTYTVQVLADCGDEQSNPVEKNFTTYFSGCEFTFNLEDSYGDGWNGNSIDLVFSNGTTQSLTISSGYSATYDVTVPEGVVMACNWTTGSYSYETSFTIEDADGNTVYSGANVQPNGFFTSMCPQIACHAPLQLAASDVVNGACVLTWIPMGEEPSWSVAYGLQGETPTMVTVTSPTFTITGMNPSDIYEVAVKALCDAENESEEVTMTIVVPALVDIAIVDVYTNLSHCDLSEAIAQIRVTNTMEDAPVSSFVASYMVNGGAAVTEMVSLSTPLAFGDTIVYTFTTAPVLTEASNVITATVYVEGETNLDDNTMSSGVTYLTQEHSIPYLENFGSSTSAQEWNAVDLGGNGTRFNIANGTMNYTASDLYSASDMMISPCLDMPVSLYLVSYDYKANSSAYNEQFTVYLNDALNLDGATPIVTHQFNNTEYQHSVERVTVGMSPMESSAHLIFNAESGVGTDGFSIDNVKVMRGLAILFNSVDGHGVVSAVSPDDYFSMSLPGGSSIYTVPQGEPMTILMQPETGYHVSAIYFEESLGESVLLRGENTTNAAVDYFTFTPETAGMVLVFYAPNNYNVNAVVNNLTYTGYNNNAPGAVYTPAHETVVHGGNHTGILTMGEHYHLVSVSVNGMDATSDLVELQNGQYSLTLTDIWEDKNIQVVAGLDSTTITYTVLAGEGTINNEFVVDGNTTLPAVYTVTLGGYTDLLSTITPAPGYHVASIIIDGVEHSIIDIYSFEHLFGDHTVEVIFAPNHYVITTTGYGNGTVTPGVEFDYTPAFTYAFAATPATGYSIASVTRNGVNLPVADPMATFTDTLTNIISNYDYVATFVHSSYTIAATAGAHGMISPAGVSTYLYHQNAEYVITADPGYYISSVTYDTVTYDFTQTTGSTTLTIPFLSIEANHTISATFAQMSYTVTVNAGANGTITPGTANYGYGATPTFVITPAEGYVISDVTVDGASVGTVPTYTFTALEADHTIAATFAAANFSITATAGNGGTITPAGVTNMAYNGNQTYTISANNGYHVSDVFVDGASVGAVTTYTFSGVTANHTIYAAFEANEYTVTVNQPANGYITPGTTTVMFGATPAFVITPNPGYNVTAITVNGTNVISNATNVNGVYTYTFPAINANQTITATMAIKTYTITASAGSNGTISPNGNTTVNHGATQSYAFNPANGYVVDNVTVDGMSFGALTAYTFTNVVANHTINVTFKLAECEVPTFMYTSHIDSTSAELHWSHPTATSFDIQYKTPTGTLTSVSNVSGNSYLLTNLNPNTTYLWQVRANCAANNHSDWSNLVTFKTDNTLDISGIEDFVKSHVHVYAEHQNVHILNNEGMNIENVRILDAYGRLVYTGSVSSSHEVIGLSVAAGTYIVNVTTDKGVANYKVTILK